MPLHSNLTPKEYLQILLRRKWLVVFSFLIVFLGAVVYCVMTKEIYKSSTTILVVAQRVPESYVRSTVSLRIEDRLSTIQQQVMSRTRLTMIMEELGLFKEQRAKVQAETVVEMIRKRIEITVRGNDSFTLSFSHEDPTMAMVTASRLATFFIDENLKTREQQAIGTSEFLESQLLESKKKLEVLENHVKEYKSRHMGELPQQIEANLTILRRFQDQYRTVGEAIRAAEERKSLLETRMNIMESMPAIRSQREGSSDMSAHPPVVASDPASPYLPEYYEKQAKLEELKTRYTDQYPGIQRLKRDVEQLEKKIEAARKGNRPEPTVQSSSSINVSQRPARNSAQEEITRLKAQILSEEIAISTMRVELKDIQKSLSEYQRKVEEAPQREQEMVSMTRDYDNMRRVYDELLRKKLDADISQNLERRQKGEQFQILDPANVPKQPFFPDRNKVFGISLALACILGFGGVFGLEAIDGRLKDVRDFKNFYDLPILGTIPTVQDERDKRKIFLLNALTVGGFVLIVAFTIFFIMVNSEKIRRVILY